MKRGQQDISVKEILNSIKLDMLKKPDNIKSFEKSELSADITDEDLLEEVMESDIEDFLDLSAKYELRSNNLMDDEPMDLLELVEDPESETEELYSDSTVTLNELENKKQEAEDLNTNKSLDYVDNYDFRDITKSLTESMENDTDAKSDESDTQALDNTDNTKEESDLSQNDSDVDAFLKTMKNSEKAISYKENLGSLADNLLINDRKRLRRPGKGVNLEEIDSYSGVADRKMSRISPQFNSNDESLISKSTEARSLKYIEKILNTKKKMQDEEEKANLRTRITIDDLALEALTPMLKKWMDDNLNRIVSEVIEKEIEKLINKASK